MPYIGKSPSFGVRNRFVFTPDAGATSVSSTDDNGSTLTFTDGAFVDVYLNGVLLKPTTDYNTNTANTIAGLTATVANDEVTVIVYDVFAVGDTVSAVNGGTFSSAVTVTTEDNNPQLTLVSTDADAVSGPILRLYRNSSSPADNDSIAQVRFVGRNDNSQDVTFSRIDSFVTDVSDGTEDSDLTLRNMVGGTLYNMVNIGATEIVINDESLDVDFRVEGNSFANLLKLDASSDTIGIGIATPTFATGRGMHFTDDFHIGFGTGNGTRPDFQLGYDSTNTRLSFKMGTGSDDSDAIFTTGGRFSIGTTNATARINVQFAHSASEQGIRITPDSTTATMIRFDNSSGTEVGTITSSGSSTAYNTSSDYRLKENVSYNWDATSRLKQLKPARFNWIDDDTNTLLDGFIAHEVSSIVPESITGDKDATQDIGTVKNSKGVVVNEGVPKGSTDTENGETWTKTGTGNVYQSIDQSKLVPLLVKTIQELEARVTALEEK